MKILVFFSAVLFVTCSTVAGDDEPVTYRLLEHQNPQHYKLDLNFGKSIFEGKTTEFTGSLTIEFKMVRTLDYIQFHAPVTIKTKQFIANQTYPVAIEKEVYDPVTHIYTITSQENLNRTYNYTLNIEYSANVDTSEMKGIYRSSYLDQDGELQYFVATHFQPTYARFAFPSFDEPKMKATLNISITYPKGLTALSNTIQIDDMVEVDDNYEKITFKETPVMSTYLVGFILSKLSCTLGTNLTNGIPYQVCSRDNLEDDRSVALELGPLYMERLENITALNYSDHLLGKLDQIAIPGYTHKFMDNWGLITYREPSILWNSEESSLAYRNVVMDLFLQLAHSWFGDLETAEWWDYVSLNHGFARFYQYHAAAQIDKLKHWELEKQFVIDQLQPAMVLDAFSDIQALSYAVESPAEILTKFTEFSYIKGASIMRMAQHVIGPQNFQKGIAYFLPIYNGSVIIPIYVWNKLEVFIPREWLPSSTNLNGGMQDWTEKAGVPLVTVTVKGNNVILTQERFLYSGETDFTEWYIPITYTVSEDFDKFENTTTKAWIEPGTSHTIYDVLEENEWIILNNQQVGYYRVNYDNVLWQEIKELLFSNHSAIHVLNRAQMVDDLLNLARAQILNYSYSFDIIKYLEYETEYYPWQSAIVNFNYLLSQLGVDSVLGKEFSSLVLELLHNVYNTLSFEEIDLDDQVYVLKLTSIAGIACKLGHESCVATSKELFANYRNGVSVDKNLRTIVFCNALRYSTGIESDWNFLWELLLTENLYSERENIISALGCTKNSTVLKNYLELSFESSSGITSEEFPKVWSAVYDGNPEGVDAAFEYLYDNYAKLSNYYSSSSSILISVTEKFTKEDQLEKLEALIASGILESSVRVIAQSCLKSSRDRLDWVGEIEEDLLDYFEVSSETEISTEKESSTPGSACGYEISFTVLGFAFMFRLYI